MADFDRIRWRCRRGLLELDLILKRFLEVHFDRLDARQRELFSELLDQPDNDLLDWALGRGVPDDPRYLPVVQLLRVC
jgi:antitoxin CptB